MRRNIPNKMSVRGGPLMTDHLHDLELELELLKRKRHLIQQQQNEIYYNRGPAEDRMRYNQPTQAYDNRFNEPQHLNFSHLYNDAPRDDRSFGLKRRAPNAWSSGPTDGYDGPMGGMGGGKRFRPDPFNRYPEQNDSQNFQRPPRTNRPQPLMSMPKPLINFPPQVRRAPQPQAMPRNQGPKPLTHHPNFKPNKQPGPNRPFVPKRNNVPGPTRTGFTPNKFNTTPNKTSPVKVFNSSLKVKKSTPVLLADREPSTKTNGRLELALGMIMKEIKFTYGRTPEYGSMFTSVPITRFMKQGVRERLRSVMTGKIVGVVPEIVAIYREKYPLETDKEIMELAAAEKRSNENTNQLAIKLLDEGDPEQYFKKNMTKLLESRWTELLRKMQKAVSDDNNAISKAEILAHIPDIKKTEEDVKGPEEPNKVIDEKPADANATSGSIDAAAEEPSDTTPEKVSDKTDEKTPDSDEVPEKTADEEATDATPKEKKYDKWMSLLLERKLPHLLSKNKASIIKLFDLDNMFRHTKAAIILNTNKKAQTLDNNATNLNSSGQSQDELQLSRNYYFVKVLATPSMPKRKIMQEFLNQFQPKTIKRHKKNYNLLFVGLDTKENYEKMLAADQTPIGNAIVSIMASSTKTTTVQKDSNADLDSVLTPQLDDQIDDLLSSIRKADEEAKANGEMNTSTDNMDSTEQQDEDKTGENVENNEEVTDSNGNGKAEEMNQTESTVSENGVAIDDDCQVIETNDKDIVTIEDDEVTPLPSEEPKTAAKAPGTPAKGRAPATPSSIRTRRSSRLVQN